MHKKQKILQEKTEEIYEVFSKYYPETGIRFCDCCYTKEEHENLKRILSSPAKSFTPHDLSEYESALAIGGWKKIKTLKHILPLYMESILLSKSNFYPYNLFYFIDSIPNKDWKEGEKELIESSLLSLLDYYLSTHPNKVYDEVSRIALASLMDIFSYLNIEKALNLWLYHSSYTSLLYLKEFVYGGTNNTRNKPLEKWLEKSKNREIFKNKIEEIILFEKQEVSEKDLVELSILYEFL